MTDIHIEELDASFIRVHCEPHISQEIAEDFTFYAPNYQHDPRYKRRIWDGKIRLFTARNLLYAGLKDRLLEWTKEKGYSHDYEYRCNARNPIAIEEWVRENTPKKFEIRPYQLDILHRCVDYGRATVLSPTASGKSLIIFWLAQFYFDKVLIIVPTINLVNQMYADFKEYGMNPDNIHKVYEGVDPNTKKDIVISTWQSIYKMEPDYFEQFGVVVGDECHGFKAKSLTHIMKQCTNAQYRFGFTATLSNDAPVHELVLEGLFGPIIRGETTKELIKQEYLSELDINIEVLEHSESERKAMRTADYNAESNFLINHKNRNAFIKDLVISLKGSTFVLFRNIAHGKELYEQISKERKCHLVYGETEADLREAIRLLANVDDTTIVCASYGVFSLGVNVPNLRNILLASPYKSKIKVLQSIGRSLRRTETKTNATIYDVVDDLSIGSHNNYGIKHYLERIKLYNKELFPYTIRRRKLPQNEEKKLRKQLRSNPSNNKVSKGL